MEHSNYSKWWLWFALASAGAAMAVFAAGVVRAESDDEPRTKTPIQHVIVIVGENHTFPQHFRRLPAEARSIRVESSVGRNNQRGRHARAQLLECGAEQGERHWAVALFTHADI
jgi:phospholipase C